MIQLAETDSEIARCFPVMVQLRPHLVEAEFLSRIRRQQSLGYFLAYLESLGRIVAVAGYRFGENLHSGRYLYVDDLVTDGSVRSHGHGQQLFDWLVERARDAGCVHFSLDSGVQRFGAHRFYLKNRMDITSHHFGFQL